MAAKKKKNRPTASRSAIRKDILAVATLSSFFLIMIAGMVSPELAMIVLGLLAMSFFAVVEKRRRNFWEQALSFTLKQVKDQNKGLRTEVEQNKNAIKALEKNIENTARKIDHERPPVNRPENPALNALAEKLDSMMDERGSKDKKDKKSDFDLERMPKSIWPQKRAAPKKPAAKKPEAVIANDEQLEYYNSLSDTIVKELLRHAIDDKNINVFVQPIMRLPQRKSRFFEMFARIRIKSGMYLPAARYLELAQKEGMINDIDNLLLMHCLATVKQNARREKPVSFFLNISPATLKNMKFMKRLLGFISENRDLAPQLVFEIRQKDFDEMQPALLQILRGLGKLGCSLSLDHIEHQNFDVPLLQAMKVRFVKFNAGFLLAKAKEKKGAADIWRIKRKLESNGIGFIVEKIESEYMLKELLDFDINYGQGFLFGRPDLQGAYKETVRKKPTQERSSA